MDYILNIVWLVALVITGVPGMAIVGGIVGTSARGWSFWLTGFLALIASFVVQYNAALQACKRRPECGVEFTSDAILTWRLAAPLVLAAILWLALDPPRRPAVAGAAAGLILSVPVVVALASPIWHV
jgi:hypothetical protein